MINALIIYSNIQGLKNKKETIDRINQTTKICEDPILSSKSENLGEEGSKSKKPTKALSWIEQVRSLSDEALNEKILEYDRRLKTLAQKIMTNPLSQKKSQSREFKNIQNQLAQLSNVKSERQRSKNIYTKDPYS